MKIETPIEVLLDRLIAETAMQNGDLLPPVQALADRLGQPVDAVRAAIDEIIDKGKFVRTANGEVIVAMPRITDAGRLFSFSGSAARHGERLVTQLLEPAAMRPPISDETHPFFDLEQRAHTALGLTPDQPFIVILRARHLHGQPKVLHRVYLDPRRFPADFLSAHDFGAESLIDIYHRGGYRLLSRDTVLHARHSNRYEDNVLAGIGREVRLPVVLDAEQRFFATDDSAGKPCVLEYMQATYLDHWPYEIPNRPA